MRLTIRSSDDYSNQPSYITEVPQGLADLANGAVILGIGGVLKIREYLGGEKVVIPCLTHDAAQLNIELGKDLIREGTEKTFFLFAVAASIYLIGRDILK